MSRMRVKESVVVEVDGAEVKNHHPHTLPPPSQPIGPEVSSVQEVVKDETHHNNHARAFWGTAWVALGFGSSQVLRFGFNLVLTRLLLPEVFGVMALANALHVGLHLFSDVGIGPSIIQNRSGDEERFLNTAWTIQALRGLLLWLALALLAWPVAIFYEIPMLLWLVPAVGANAAIAGFNSTSIHTLARRLVRGPLVILNLASYVVGMAVTIAWVFCIRADVWGFVIGGLVTSLITMVVSHLLLAGPRNRPCWDGSSLRELTRFGKWIFVSTLCTFLADQTDRLVLGKVATLAVLGLYQVASQLTLIPVTLIAVISAQVVFALYSRQHQSDQGITSAIRRIHPLMVGFAAATATGLFVAGPTLLACLYGARYAEAGWMVPLLAVGAFFKMVASAASTALMATGQSRTPAVGNAVKAVGLIVLLPAGYHLGGLGGLLCALAVADVMRYAIMVVALQRQGESVFRCDLILVLCGVAIGAAAHTACQQFGGLANDWGKLGVSAGVILTLWGGLLVAVRGRRLGWVRL